MVRVIRIYILLILIFFLSFLVYLYSSIFYLDTRMYDVDGNGVIEREEMSKIVQSIYAMMGPDQSLAERQMETAEQRAENIFKRMDINSDGKVEKREFVRCCMQDKKLIGLLTPQPLN